MEGNFATIGAFYFVNVFNEDLKSDNLNPLTLSFFFFF